MGAIILYGMYLDLKDNYPSSRPATPGQQLDKALEDQKRQHDRQMRRMEQELESLKRRQSLGL